MTHTDVEVWPIDELIPYSNNPKEHPDEQVQKIASSIKNYGWDQPIVVDGGGEIIKGHGRRQAAQVLGLDEVPVIVRGDLTDAEARAARIADNKTAESPWDDELVGVEIEQLVDEPIDLNTLGYDDNELDSLSGRCRWGTRIFRRPLGTYRTGSATRYAQNRSHLQRTNLILWMMQLSR